MSVPEFVLIGAGNRGQGVFGKYALDMPHRCRFTAVVEPDVEKRTLFAEQHGIPRSNCFATYREYFAAPVDSVSGAVIATLEDERTEPLLACMQQGYHILVEKPLCRNVEELVRLSDVTRDYAGVLVVCHQMRLAPAYRTIKELLESGRYGELICIQHSENLAYSHMAHSFVRGFFNSHRLAPMLLAKCCHDTDLMTYWIDRPVRRVSSFGALTHFTPLRKPKGAPDYCLLGCSHYATCPYHVLKLYFDEKTDPAYLRQMGVIRNKQHLLGLLRTNRFGRCVFAADNDVVDHQIVNAEFDGGILASFTMCGHNGVERRITKISLSNGEIAYDTSMGDITAYRFEPNQCETYRVDQSGTHGGGDRAIMDNFVDAIVSGDTSRLLTPIRFSLEGHFLVFAAEEARKHGVVVDISSYEQRIRRSLSVLNS